MIEQLKLMVFVLVLFHGLLFVIRDFGGLVASNFYLWELLHSYGGTSYISQ
jgi:hypothetical protein